MENRIRLAVSEIARSLVSLRLMTVVEADHRLGLRLYSILEPLLDHPIYAQPEFHSKI